MLRPSFGRTQHDIANGQYRIVYAVLGRELVVLVVAAGHRRDVYKKLR